MSEISERLRLRRIVMNLSQREAAEKIGYSTAAAAITHDRCLV